MLLGLNWFLIAFSPAFVVNNDLISFNASSVVPLFTSFDIWSFWALSKEVAPSSFINFASFATLALCFAPSTLIATPTVPCPTPLNAFSAWSYSLFFILTATSNALFPSWKTLNAPKPTAIIGPKTGTKEQATAVAATIPIVITGCSITAVKGDKTPFIKFLAHSEISNLPLFDLSCFSPEISIESGLFSSLIFSCLFKLSSLLFDAILFVSST